MPSDMEWVCCGHLDQPQVENLAGELLVGQARIP